MENTWASGSIELLEHANGHLKLESAFDKRMAFISIDNSVEITIKTYLTLPKQIFGTHRPSLKEIEECNNGFTNYLSLLIKYAKDKLTGIEAGDIEHFHRIRNKLYHDGSGLSVDSHYLEAYFTIAKLLLKRLMNVDFEYKSKTPSLELVIINWNKIQELVSQIFESPRVFDGTFKWESAVQEGLLDFELVSEITEIRRIRNRLVHSTEIDDFAIKDAFNRSEKALKKLTSYAKASKDQLYRTKYFFRPSTSKLRGIIESRSLFGPPGYGENPDVDKKLTALVLMLEKPINVFQTTEKLEEGDFDSTRYNQNQIQLAFQNKLDQEKFIGKKVEAMGELFGAHTGYHITEVLLSVQKVTLL